MITAEEMSENIVPQEVLRDIKLIEEKMSEAITSGSSEICFHGNGFEDQTIKYLLDHGYHYIERGGVFGDFEVIISCKPYKIGIFDYEVTYDDLKL